VIGAGYSGKRIAEIGTHLADLLAQSPTHVVIEGGWNDLACNHTATQAYADLTALTRAAKGVGATVVVAGGTGMARTSARPVGCGVGGRRSLHPDHHPEEPAWKSMRSSSRSPGPN
jgi:hypothetical protein